MFVRINLLKKASATTVPDSTTHALAPHGIDRETAGHHRNAPVMIPDSMHIPRCPISSKKQMEDFIHGFSGEMKDRCRHFPTPFSEAEMAVFGRKTRPGIWHVVYVYLISVQKV